MYALVARKRLSTMLDRLERKLGRFAIPHLTLLLVAGQTGSYFLSRARPAFIAQLVLIPDLVLRGEVWRLVTFLFMPPGGGGGTLGLIMVLIALYVFYFIGSTLEAQWGEFRYNAYLFIGWLATVGASFAMPGMIGTNVYLGGSIFLAFAFLYPDYTFLLFFILPVKVKWLAWLTWALYVYQFATGGWGTRIMIAAGVVNFFVFFGNEIRLRLRQRGRKTTHRVKAKREEQKPFHRCRVCGITDKDDPDMQFRYCPDCEGSPGYCMKHIRDHEHIGHTHQTSGDTPA